MPRVGNMKAGARGLGSKSDIESGDDRVSGELHGCVDTLRLGLQAHVLPLVWVHVRVVESRGCNGLWPLIVESLWLQWPVAAGCRTP